MKSKRQLRRFFSSEKIPEVSQTFCLSSAESRHLSHVIRLQPGDFCLVGDGTGAEAVSQIVAFREDGHAELKVTEKETRSASSQTMPIRIFQAVPKQAKFDFLVQKAQELGLWELVPVISERTVVRIETGRKMEAKLERWQKIAVEAAKQSGNLQILRIASPCDFKEAIALIQPGERVAAFHPDGDKKTFTAWIGELRQAGFAGILNLFIGPEGGFSEKEIDFLLEYCRSKGCPFDRVGLGETILKVDTAFTGALAAIRFMTLE